MTKDQYDVDALIIERGTTAEALLKDAFPKAISTFKKHVDGLNALLKEIRKEFPDANYYLDEESLRLLLGSSHEGSGYVDGTGDRRQDRIACAEILTRSGGGGWIP